MSASTTPVQSASTAVLSPRALLPLLLSMAAVFTALLAQQAVIDAAEKRRER